ncbi:HAMP domain protein [Desulfovibrio sp. A2]|nr:HAMP domain protein [Desulfovibrio sp. A2]
MRIRTKLLVLLLAITVIPLLVLGGIRVHSSLELGQDLARRQTGTLIEQARTLMTVIAEDHAHTLQRERQLLETALRFQTLAARARLRGPVPRDPDPVLFDTDISQKSGSLRLRKLRTRCAWLGQAPPKAGPVECVDKQVFHLAPGLTREAAQPDVARLSDLDDDHREVSGGMSDLTAWQVTALESGLVSIYPGHDQFPSGYDARQSPWYQKALHSDELVWAAPVLDDASGEILFTAALSIRNGKGVPVAVSAIMASLNVLLQQNEHTRHLSGNMEAMFVTREEDEGGTSHLRILAHREPDGARHAHGTTGAEDVGANFKSHLAAMVDPQAEQLVLEHIRSGVTSVFQAPNRGVASLWAIAPVPGDAGVLIFTAPLDDILREVRGANEYLSKRMGEQIVQAVLILGLTIMLISILSFFIAKRFTGPLLLLSEAARQLSQGDFRAKVAIRGKDELAELGKVFNEMGPRIVDTIRIQEGVALAMQVQQKLLPRKAPDVPGLDVAGISVYCDETGGDYYDFFLRENVRYGRSLAVAVGDVSGHGMEAALLMTTARAFLRMRADMPGAPSEIVTDVNCFLSRDTAGTGRFMSLFYLEIDPSDKSLAWVRAGHDPALLYDPQTGSFVELGGAGLTLGVEEQWMYTECGRPCFKPGQIVVLGSDGIWETRDGLGEMFGKERFRRVIQEHSADSSAENIVNAVLDALDRFRSGHQADDDVTLVVIKSV